MKRTLLIVLTLTLTCSFRPSYGQLYFTKNGRISFFSKTSFQDIQADNNQVLSVLNLQTGTIQFSVLNDAFYFPKAKMQEDFNENYMESNKYPKSTFKGTISDISSVDVSKDGNYTIHVTGELMIHGVSQKISSTGTIMVKNGKLSATAAFYVLLKDYNISIPSIVNNKIAEKIRVTIDCNYEKK